MDKLIYYIRRGALESSPEKFIRIKDLHECGAVTKPKHGVKLLSKGLDYLEEIPPIFIEVSDASESVIEAIHKNGGQVIFTGE